MNLSQFKQLKYYLFYDDSIYNLTFENITLWENETLLYLQTILEEQTALIFFLLKIETRTLSNILGWASKLSIAAV